MFSTVHSREVFLLSGAPPCSFRWLSFPLLVAGVQGLRLYKVAVLLLFLLIGLLDRRSGLLPRLHDLAHKRCVEERGQTRSARVVVWSCARVGERTDEHLLDVDLLLRRGLHELRIELLGQLLALLLRHLPLVLQVRLRRARAGARAAVKHSPSRYKTTAVGHTHGAPRYLVADEDKGYPAAAVLDALDGAVEDLDLVVAAAEDDGVHAQEAVTRPVVLVPDGREVVLPCARLPTSR